MASTLAAADEFTTMETRGASPTNILMKIESFSSFDIDKYESIEFAAGEYKWRLIIYPDGDETGNESGYVSVYLAMAETSCLPINWEVNATFSIFLYNHISDTYLYSLGKTRRFLGTTSEWGLSKFIPKKILLDPSKGYLKNDNCVFGAEVFVVKREAAVIEYLSFKNFDLPYKHDLRISNFSQLRNMYWESETFSVEGYDWSIYIQPDKATRRYLSIFLYIYTPPKNVKAYFTICLKNQINGQHIERSDTHWFSKTSHEWGWHSFVELATINDPRKGFIVNDSCLIDVEISVVSQASPLHIC